MSSPATLLKTASGTATPARFVALCAASLNRLVSLEDAIAHSPDPTELNQMLGHTNSKV